MMDSRYRLAIRTSEAERAASWKAEHFASKAKALDTHPNLREYYRRMANMYAALGYSYQGVKP